MPTILLQSGWRVLFDSSEGDEPVHVHCRKAGMECKYWLLAETFDLELAYANGLSPQSQREIRKILFEHFDYIIQQWVEFQSRKDDE